MHKFLYKTLLNGGDCPHDVALSVARVFAKLTQGCDFAAEVLLCCAESGWWSWVAALAHLPHCLFVFFLLLLKAVFTDSSFSSLVAVVKQWRANPETIKAYGYGLGTVANVFAQCEQSQQCVSSLAFCFPFDQLLPCDCASPPPLLCWEHTHRLLLDGDLLPFICEGLFGHSWWLALQCFEMLHRMETVIPSFLSPFRFFFHRAWSQKVYCVRMHV